MVTLVPHFTIERGLCKQIGWHVIIPSFCLAVSLPIGSLPIGAACAARQPVCSCDQCGLLCGTKEAIGGMVQRASFRLNLEPRTCEMGQCTNELYCHEVMPVLCVGDSTRNKHVVFHNSKSFNKR